MRFHNDRYWIWRNLWRKIALLSVFLKYPAQARNFDGITQRCPGPVSFHVTHHSRIDPALFQGTLDNFGLGHRTWHGVSIGLAPMIDRA